MNREYRQFRTLTGLAGMLLLQTACSSSTDSVEGRVTLVDRTTNALLAANIDAIGGTYGATCNERNSGGWLVQLTGATPSNNLSVVLNDDDCILTLGGISVAGNGPGPIGLALDDEYAPLATFVPGFTPFYLNASVSSLAFAEDFYLTLLFSDDPITSSAAANSQFAVSQSIVALESVPAPAITLGLGGLELAVDAEDLLVTATGSATTLDTTPVGDAGVGDLTYFVSALGAAALENYGQINAEYLALEAGPGPTASLGATVPAEAFGLSVGVALPQIRSLIIANTVEGVRSYTVFTITFSLPTIIE